ncbi:MAG: molybdate ABC transporter substrate-binding protein [Anaerolinea sp.]|nr:molybdate ABC transporter substrate-binding protein [Anaerolinea sp.]
MKKVLPVLLWIALVMPACMPSTQAPAAPAELTEAAATIPQPPANVEITVLAAGSLTEAFSEIGILFEEAHPGVKVVFSFAGSQQLAHQIAEGAPADVFASASNKHMQVTIESGRVEERAAVIFVKNNLVVIFPADNPGQIVTLADLARPGLKLDLAAAEVPVGKYTLEFLDSAALDADYSPSFKDDVLLNVVSYEENVKSVLTKVQLGEADAGIVYTSDVAGDAAAGLGVLEIPDQLNVIASYPIAPLSDSKNLELAKTFIAFVLSSQGQAVLAQYGFMAVE